MLCTLHIPGLNVDCCCSALVAGKDISILPFPSQVQKSKVKSSHLEVTLCSGWKGEKKVIANLEMLGSMLLL